MCILYLPRVSDEINDALTIIMQEKGISKSQLVAEALSMYIIRENAPRNRTAVSLEKQIEECQTHINQLLNQLKTQVGLMTVCD